MKFIRIIVSQKFHSCLLEQLSDSYKYDKIESNLISNLKYVLARRKLLPRSKS